MKYVNCNVLSAPDTATQTGIQIDASQLYAASFQAYFGDSTAAGTLTVQGSNDEPPSFYQPNLFTATNWSSIPSASATITAGASAIILIPVTSFRWMRVVYTYTSGGSSTINVNMMATAV